MESAAKKASGANDGGRVNKCSKCGQPKAGHICPGAKPLDTIPEGDEELEGDM